MDTASLSVEPDKANYAVGENVAITAINTKNNEPVANEPIRVSVFRPSGEKIFHTIVHTDKLGTAVAVFSLKKNKPGSYFVEAHNASGIMGLSSFHIV